MKVGVCMLPSHFADWDRFLARENGESVPSRPAVPDEDLLLGDIELHAQAEELGFDSLWTVEHHFTPYALVPNPLQVLTHFAARTTKIELGSLVVVLPWHNPVRVAEEMMMLQILMGTERPARIGFGRGLGQREFKGLEIDQDSARGRFVEGIEVIQRALRDDYFSFSGEHFNVPESALRPRSVAAAETLLEHMCGAWGSPSSAPIVGKAGLKPVIIPIQPWLTYGDQLGQIAEIREAEGLEPAKPIAMTRIFCAETESEAREGAVEYFREYDEAAIRHYELMGDHFKNLSTYGDYTKYGEERAKSKEKKIEDSQHVWGTPEMCIEAIEKIKEMIDPSDLVFQLKFGTMSPELGERSMKLIAEEIVPAVKAMGTDSAPVS